MYIQTMTDRVEFYKQQQCVLGQNQIVHVCISSLSVYVLKPQRHSLYCIESTSYARIRQPPTPIHTQGLLLSSTTVYHILSAPAP